MSSREERRKMIHEDDPAFMDRFKELWLTTFSVNHRTSVIMLFIIVSIAGVISYINLPKEAQPEVELPYVAINTQYPGVSPADMETLVTRPLEEELNTIADVEEMRSTSVEGYSSITMEFSVDMDINEALQRVREKVDLAAPDLPDDAEDPSIVEFNVTEFPIMQVNLAGQYGLVRLKEIGEDLQDQLEQIPEVLRVDLRGGLEREVKVDVDLPRLKYYSLGLGDVVDAIREENVNIPGGTIDVGSVNYLVRVDGEFVDPSVIDGLIVGTYDGRPVYVRDVANVEFGFADRTSYAKLDGNPVVTLDIVKRSGANIIDAADQVKEILADMGPSFPPTTQVSITGDQSREIEMMVSSLENSIVSGLILILAILLFFLGLRTASFVAVAIPTSMLLSFVILTLLGITMNMVVLFSLILALGMLVDNAIVIVENIYRFVHEGWSPAAAAKKATGEVAVPVIAATATTLAAFAPLMFWPGMVGEFMGFLPLTLIITLSSSLFVALVIVPVLCAIFLKPEDAPPKPLTRTARRTILVGSVVALGVIAYFNVTTAAVTAVTVVVLWALHRFLLDGMARSFQTVAIPAVLDRYERILRGALRHRGWVVAGCAAAFAGTGGIFYLFNHGLEYFPEDIPPAQMIVNAEAPVGTRVDFTESVTSQLERNLGDMPGMGDVESIVTTAGGSAGGPGAGAAMFMGGGGPTGENEGQIILSLVDFQDRKSDSFETLKALQERLGANVSGAEINADMPAQGPSTGPPVNIEVVGEDPAELKRLSDRIVEILKNAPVSTHLVSLESDLDEARPELSVHVDRELAALHGLSTFEVGNAVRGAIQGIEAAKYRTGNDEYDIVVRLAEPYRDQLSSLEDLVVYSDGTPVPLVSVASWSVEEGLGSIHRKDMDRLATISADVRAGFNQNQVLTEVQQTLADFTAQELPPGYQLRYTGQLEDQMEAQQFLTWAFVIALMLIAFILISQFNSIVKPLIILTSVIMSTVGVLVGLMVFDLPFVVVMTGIGIISLAGIVVNNAIVLIDYIDILRERDGMNRREALVQGGLTRFRPVMLTALTTALGLVPLAVGLNFDFFGLFASLSPDFYWGGEQAAWWRNMAITVIVGIVLATFLTLVLVPVMYALVDDLAAFFRRRFVGEPIPVAVGGGPGASDGTSEPGSSDVGADGSDVTERPESRPHPSREPVLRRERATPGDLLPDAG